MPEDEIRGEGFTIKDRRTFDTEGKVKEEAKKEEKKEEAKKDERAEEREEKDILHPVS